MGYTGKVYGLHRQSMGYTVLSMGYRGLHRQSMGYTVLSMGYRELHRQSMGYTVYTGNNIMSMTCWPTNSQPTNQLTDLSCSEQSSLAIRRGR